MGDKKEKNPQRKERSKGGGQDCEGEMQIPFRVGLPEVHPAWPIGKFSAIRRNFPIGGEPVLLLLLEDFR